MVHEGDLLLSNSMSFGRPYIMKTSGCIHDGWLVLSDKSGLFTLDYLYYFLGSKAAYRQFNDRAVGSTVRNLNIDLVRSVEVPLPPIPEQKRIVAILDEACAAIATATAYAEQNLANAQELFESQLSRLFTALETEHACVSIDEIAKVRSGKRVPKGYKLKLEPTPYPYISVADFTDDGSVNVNSVRYIEQSIYESISRFVITKEDLYISIAGTIGKTGIVPDDLDGANLTENACRLVLSESASNCYVYWYTKSRLFQAQAEEQTRTAAQPKLALSRLKKIRLPLPPNKTQWKVVNSCTALARQLGNAKSLLSRKLECLSTLKQSLLHKAFTGELTAHTKTANRTLAEAGV